MKFVVPAFAGMAPRFSDHLLDDMQASDAANLKVTNGDLRGFRGLKKVTTLPPVEGGYRKVRKLYKPGTDEFVWWGHPNPAATALGGPLVNDAFDRVYLSDAVGQPLVTTWQNLSDGGGAYHTLGVPRPGGGPGVVAAPGTEDVRAYVYTFRTAFGEEGMPSDPTTATGAPSGTWQVNLPAPDSIGFNVVSIDIYRTATGEKSAGDYFRVGTVYGGTTVFLDGMANDVVPLQLPLTSDLYEGPPDNLQGLVMHSSGAMVGFAGNQVCFSEPYLPHAWPSDYRYTVPNPVVAVAAFSNAIAVLTTGFPTLLAGNHPASISIINMTDVEPCIAPRSVVATGNVVLYASPNGLMQVGTEGLTRLSNQLFTREEWARFIRQDMVAVKYSSWYVALIGSASGFAMALPPYEPSSVVRLDRYLDVTTLETDERNGDALVVQTTVVSRFDVQSDRRLGTVWSSKEWIAPYPVNLGAVQVLYQVNRQDERDRALNDARADYNQARFDVGMLDALNLYAIGGEAGPLDLEVEALPVPGDEQLIPPPTQPMGGEPLFDETDRSRITSLRLVFYADDRERYARVIGDELVHKLPSGYKATRFRVTLEGNAEVQRVILAETAKECRGA